MLVLLNMSAAAADVTVPDAGGAGAGWEIAAGTHRAESERVEAGSCALAPFEAVVLRQATAR